MQKLLLSLFIQIPFIILSADKTREIIPSSTISYAENNIKQAYLANPTTIYKHGALGDNIEAKSLVVLLEDNKEDIYTLSKGFVFEDLKVRIIDLDNDGDDEILVIKTDIKKGASIAIFEIINNKLVLKAQNKPIGLRYRWLNIVGAADLDRDGNIEIAYVETPHIGGVLKIYRYNGKELVFITEKYGFSNHQNHTTRQNLAKIKNINTDKYLEIVIPDEDRRTLKIIQFKSDKLQEIKQ